MSEFNIWKSRELEIERVVGMKKMKGEEVFSEKDRYFIDRKIDILS